MRFYIFLISCMFCRGVVDGQRLAPGQKAIEANWGASSMKSPGQSYYLEAGFNSIGRHCNYWFWSGEYSRRLSTYVSHDKDIDVLLETYTVQGGRSFYLLGDFRRSVTLNLGVWAVGGYEAINKGNKLLPDGAVINNESAFVYGAGGRLSLEAYLSNRFVLLLRGGANVLLGTSLRQCRPGTSGGVRFNL
ncbi:MAG: conjugal transfer protein TraO [Niabella sp.]|nr:conjugal transfer protein TraO [Niabella sp.]